MSFVDTFSLLFKSNAKETAADIEQLDKKIAELAKKGSKKDEEEQKSLKELRHQRSLLTQDLKDQTKTVDSLSDSLLNVGIAAVAAVGGFEGLKAGITHAVNMNSELEKLHQMTGANVKDVAAWDAAFTQFTGKKGEFASWFADTAQNIQQIGGSVKNMMPYLMGVAAQLKQMRQEKGDEAAQDWFQSQYVRTGILQSDQYLALQNGPEELQKVIDRQSELLSVTEDTAQAGRDVEKQWDALGTEVGAVFTDIMPFIDGFVESLKDIVRLIRLIVDVPSLNFTDLGKTFDAMAHDVEDKKKKLQKEDSDTIKRVSDFFTGKKESSPSAMSAVSGSPAAVVSASPSAMSYGASTFARATKGSADIGNYLATDSKLNIIGVAGAALSAADRTPIGRLSAGGAMNSTVNISNLTVQTQATDANGIASDIRKSLDEHLAYLVANNNDGIAK